MQVLIKPKCFNLQIRTKASITALNPVTPESNIPVIDRILTLNQIALSLNPLRRQANKENSLYKLENGILTYDGRLVMLVREEEILVAELLYKIHE
jgi:hypothetical protein